MSEENFDGLVDKDFDFDPACESAFPDQIQDESEQTNDEFDTSEFDKTDYKVKNIEEFVDVNKGEIIDKNSLTPWDKIKYLAKQLNVKIQDPDTSCKKCFGRGYTSIDAESKTPIPCLCIFTEKVNPADMNSSTLMKHNRHTRRNMDKLMAAQRRIILRESEKAEQKKTPTKAFIKKKNNKKMREQTRKINRGKK